MSRKQEQGSKLFPYGGADKFNGFVPTNIRHQRRKNSNIENRSKIFEGMNDRKRLIENQTA